MYHAQSIHVRYMVCAFTVSPCLRCAHSCHSVIACVVLLSYLRCMCNVLPSLYVLVACYMGAA